MAYTRILFRRDTGAQWELINPVLEQGEIGLIIDSLGQGTVLFKVGDGSTAWNDLSYASGPAGQTGPKGDKGDTGATGVKGAAGAQGPTGPQGPAGKDGVNGVNGAAGPQGPTGAKGATGAQGPKGDKGDTPPLTDAVNSTDHNTAASAYAVKLAYDRGSAGVSAAATAKSAADSAQNSADAAQSTANTAKNNASAAQSEADAVGSALTTHGAATAAHGATSGATASRMMIRDASGRAQVATPSASADIATKGYVDGKVPGSGAAPKPIATAGVGQVGSKVATSGLPTLPAGGTWFWFVLPYSSALGTVAINNTMNGDLCGVAAGGTTVGVTSGSSNTCGVIYWRIA